MKKLIIKNGKSIYVDLTQDELDELRERKQKAIAEDDDENQRRLKKRAALKRLKENYPKFLPMIRDILILLNEDED